MWHLIGLADDLWMRHIVDLGLVGPDKGKGGVASGHEGKVEGVAAEVIFELKELVRRRSQR